jgi:hypothetical protein
MQAVRTRSGLLVRPDGAPAGSHSWTPERVNAHQIEQVDELVHRLGVMKAFEYYGAAQSVAQKLALKAELEHRSHTAAGFRAACEYLNQCEALLVQRHG